MSKNKQKTLVEKILDKANIPYKSLYKPSNQEQMIYKTIAFESPSKEVIIGIAPINSKISTKKLAKVAKVKHLDLIPLKNLVRATGFKHGANSAVGIRQNHNYPIFFDHSAENKIVIMSAGKIDYSISVNADDVKKFVNGTYADIVQD